MNELQGAGARALAGRGDSTAVARVLDIAERANLNFVAAHNAAETLLKHGLLDDYGTGSRRAEAVRLQSVGK